MLLCILWQEMDLYIEQPNNSKHRIGHRLPHVETDQSKEIYPWNQSRWHGRREDLSCVISKANHKLYRVCGCVHNRGWWDVQCGEVDSDEKVRQYVLGYHSRVQPLAYTKLWFSMRFFNSKSDLPVLIGVFEGQWNTKCSRLRSSLVISMDSNSGAGAHGSEVPKIKILIHLGWKMYLSPSWRVRKGVTLIALVKLTLSPLSFFSLVWWRAVSNDNKRKPISTN